jgi:hypothetical protein
MNFACLTLRLLGKVIIISISFKSLSLSLLKQKTFHLLADTPTFPNKDARFKKRVIEKFAQ